MPWGYHLILNLYNCNGKIKKERAIVDFLYSLANKIDMHAFLSPIVGRFGTGALEGVSGILFIYQSAISIHCDEQQNRVFLDVFSCKEFDWKKVISYAKEYFSARGYSYKYLERK